MCKQVEHGDMSSNHKKNKYKIWWDVKIQKVMCANDSIVCKLHCQYEVDDNECEYITDCEGESEPSVNVFISDRRGVIWVLAQIRSRVECSGLVLLGSCRANWSNVMRWSPAEPMTSADSLLKPRVTFYFIILRVGNRKSIPIPESDT